METSRGGGWSFFPSQSDSPGNFDVRPSLCVSPSNSKLKFFFFLNNIKQYFICCTVFSLFTPELFIV